MSEAKKRQTVVTFGKAWTADHDVLLGTMTDKEVGERTGRKEGAVSARRYRMGVSAFVKRRPHRAPAIWTPAKDRLLGTMSDVDLARKLRCSPMSVFYRRRRLNIAAFRA